eukprot:GHRR01023947.1.p1 GENE.GHRR01023947.1~~GHRR01023947.1.p1  ORF type:complete len:330 (+),score=174.79 GHRR01023947.1:193-1182(+)
MSGCMMCGQLCMMPDYVANGIVFTPWLSIHCVYMMFLFLQEFGIVEQDEEEDDKAGDADEDDIRPSAQLSAAAAATITGTAAAGAAPNGVVVPIAPGVQPPNSTTAAMLAAAAAAGAAPAATGAAAPGAAVSKFMPALPGQQFPGQAMPQTPQNLIEAAKAAAEKAAAQFMGQAAPGATAAAAATNPALAAAQAAAMRAAALAAAFAQGGGVPAAGAAAGQQQAAKLPGFESEIVINDFPQNARWKVTHKGFQAEITELTGAAVTTKGIYVAAGEPPEGERKLYLLIEAPTEAQVRRAKQEIRKVIEEYVEKAMRRDVGARAGGRYNVM